MGLKLAGLFTSIPAFLSSGETWASLTCVGKWPWLKDTDVGTKSMGDDFAGMVFSCFITSLTVTGLNSVSCGPQCALSKMNKLLSTYSDCVLHTAEKI